VRLFLTETPERDENKNEEREKRDIRQEGSRLHGRVKNPRRRGIKDERGGDHSIGRGGDSLKKAWIVLEKFGPNR